MISIAHTTNRDVTRWRDGQMVRRRTAAGMLDAERSSRPHQGLQAAQMTAGEGDATRRDRRGYRDDPLCAVWSGALTFDRRRNGGTSPLLAALTFNGTVTLSDADTATNHISHVRHT